MRSRTLLLLAIAVTSVPVAWHGMLDRARDGSAVSASTGTPFPMVHEQRLPPAAAALRVLRRWDQRRWEAWARGDVAALSRLYVPASRTGDRDRQALRRWLARGLRVAGLRQQIETVQVAHADPGSWVVVVTERTVGGVAVDGRRREALPASAWSTHRIRLERSADSWRVAEVRDQPAR